MFLCWTNTIYLFFRRGQDPAWQNLKQGNKYLRWALIEAVIPVTRKDARSKKILLFDEG